MPRLEFLRDDFRELFLGGGERKCFACLIPPPPGGVGGGAPKGMLGAVTQMIPCKRIAQRFIIRFNQGLPPSPDGILLTVAFAAIFRRGGGCFQVGVANRSVLGREKNIPTRLLIFVVPEK